jgi:lipopolysaccharide transport system permease protein
MFNSLWLYRGFILGSVKREFQVKYRNSLLGATWNVLNPLAMVVVYTVIFSKIMGARLSGIEGTFAYSIYLCAGSLTWGLFSEITSRGQNVFLENAGLLKKITFPRLCLPLVVVINALINFSIIFGLFVIFLILSGSFPGVVFFSILPVLLILIAFAIGLGITLGVLNVFFRDVGQFFLIFLQFWFWFTPIVYMSSVLPDYASYLMRLNPMASLIGAFQEVIVQGVFPDWGSLLYPFATAVFFCFIGIKLFLRHAGDIVDEL